MTLRKPRNESASKNSKKLRTRLLTELLGIATMVVKMYAIRREGEYEVLHLWCAHREDIALCTRCGTLSTKVHQEEQGCIRHLALLKEEFRTIFEKIVCREMAARFLDVWILKAERTGDKYLSKFVATFKNWREQILNYFIERITNGFVEGLNNGLRTMIRTAFGFRNFNNFRTRKKHKISFQEAQTVFTDPNARMIFDPEHSRNEDRFVLLGISAALRLMHS